MKHALFAVFAVLALAIPIAGCGGSEDNVTALERIINEQLPTQVEESGAKNVAVAGVSCKEGSAGGYDCTADVSGEDADGKKIDETVNITGTCNDSSCKWETK